MTEQRREPEETGADARRYHCPLSTCPRHRLSLTPDQAHHLEGICPECGRELVTPRGTGFFEEHGSYP